MINPDWDHSKKNYDVVFRLLIICMRDPMYDQRIFVKARPAKNILGDHPGGLHYFLAGYCSS